MTDRNCSDPKITAIIKELDDEILVALTQLVDDSPDLLRQTLDEYGYLDGSDGNSDEYLANRTAAELSNAQRELADHLAGQLEDSMTVSEILELVGSEESEFRQQYSSAQYRSWISNQLNALVEAGEIGRYKDGREVRYTETPALAVRHWSRLNSRFIDDLEVVDAVDIKNDTGMPPKIVKNAIRKVTDD